MINKWKLVFSILGIIIGLLFFYFWYWFTFWLLDNIPFFDVGQSPLQGDLDYSRVKPFTDTKGVKPNINLPLIEE